MFGARAKEPEHGPAWRDEPTHYYALFKAFDECAKYTADPIGDECDLPAPKGDIEIALFLSFNGIINTMQYLHLKKLITLLGSFIKLSERDRSSIATRKLLLKCRENTDPEVSAELNRIMGWSLTHYEGVLSRSLRSTVEMKKKVDAFDTQFKLADRFDAQS